jgi:hypothetical protein
MDYAIFHLLSLPNYIASYICSIAANETSNYPSFGF